MSNLKYKVIAVEIPESVLRAACIYLWSDAAGMAGISEITLFDFYAYSKAPNPEQTNLPPNIATIPIFARLQFNDGAQEEIRLVFSGSLNNLEGSPAPGYTIIFKNPLDASSSNPSSSLRFLLFVPTEVTSGSFASNRWTTSFMQVFGKQYRQNGAEYTLQSEELLDFVGNVGYDGQPAYNVEYSLGFRAYETSQIPGYSGDYLCKLSTSANAMVGADGGKIQMIRHADVTELETICGESIPFEYYTSGGGGGGE